MGTPSHHFVTVDMRGMKPALVARAQAERVSVSVLVRRAVAREIEVDDGRSDAATAPADSRPQPATVKLSIRLTAAEAQRFGAGAQAASLSRGAYLAGLIAGIPVLSNGAGRSDHVQALTASTAELATLNRNMHHLSTLLSRGATEAAMQYRDMLATLADDVHGHLRLASADLADLKPARETRSLTPSP